MTADSLARPLFATTAALLEQGATLDRLSRPLTAASLIGLVLLPLLGPVTALSLALVGLIALAGLAELYLALRVGFDAALFRELAESGEAAELAPLDAGLSRLGLRPAAKAGRPAADRVAGAQRLLRRQAVALAAQLGVVALAAAFAATS
jgi:hypothetical protein